MDCVGTLLFKVVVHVVQYLHVFSRDGGSLLRDGSLHGQVHVVEVNVSVFLSIPDTHTIPRKGPYKNKQRKQEKKKYVQKKRKVFLVTLHIHLSAFLTLHTLHM